jgi:hypothetical protein
MLRWTPQWTLERGLVETANWFKASSFARAEPIPETADHS